MAHARVFLLATAVSSAATVMVGSASVAKKPAGRGIGTTRISVPMRRCIDG